MLGHWIAAEVAVIPVFVWVGFNDIPRDVGILAEETVVPGFMWVGRHDIPCDVGIRAEATVGMNSIPDDSL